jgi:two-component system, chemotaxis family, CheB/CheR fusion protein
MSNKDDSSKANLQNISQISGPDNIGESLDDSYNIKKTFCVGVGASAGGLEALEQFFKNMPSDSGLSFVVVQHLSPDYKSLMVELLSKHTDMKVYRAEDGMKILPNCIYLIPPKKNMTIFHDKLFLTEQVHQHVINLPIDIFFRSLADDYGDRSIGIILSGTGSDGTLGIRAIKGTGGMVMAQDDISAKFDGMPKSAISTGLVDYILPADKMPEELLKYVKHPLTIKTEEKTEQFSDENMLGKVMAIIRNRVGVDFTYYKPNTITRRLERRISINQIDSFENYVTFLEQSPKEVNILYKELLIGVTKFFRDPEAFDILKAQIIPELFKNKKKDESIRFWSMGCSTGEEAYTLAILLREYMEKTDQVHDVKIFATDLDKESLEYGSMGFYTESIVADVSMERLKKYFVKKDKGYQINENIRKMVIFATHNVIKDPPFSKIDLVSCRNMLIYLKPVMQKKVLSLFHFAMSRSGFLFLGSSESLGDLSKNFKTINSKWKIYGYKEGFANESITDFLIPNLRKSRTIQYNEPNTKIASGYSDINESILNSLINEFVPPSLIVDENHEIVHVCKDVNRYVKIPPGKISLNVLSLLRQELNTPTSIAIHKALKENKEVVYKDFKLKEKGETLFIDIKVKPITNGDKNRKLIFIIFDEKRTVQDKENNKNEVYIEYDVNQQIKDLELELKYTKENLQATIEELGTSNEELQSTNEELISSNEELQSTNEELQSVNEELYTVNSEYQNKIEELTQLNNDINNLLKNTNIGTVFLDRNLLIRKFTPAVSSAINILDMDIGRPIHHISHNTLYTRFIDDIENVIRTLVPKETEVQGKNDNWFLMRILPYRTIENAIDGVVITFLDITERKNFEKKIEQKSELLISVLENSPIASTILDKTGQITYANQMAEQVLGLKKSEITSRAFNSVSWRITDEEGNDFSSEKLPFTLVMKNCQPVFDIVHCIEWPEGKRITLSVNGSPIFDEFGEINGGVFTMLNITEKRKLEEKLIQERELFLRVIENSPNAKLMIDKGGKITFFNKLASGLFETGDIDLKKGPLNFKSLGLKTIESLDGSQDILDFIFRNGKSVYNIEHLNTKALKANQRLYITASPVFDENRNVSGAVLSIDQYKDEIIRINKLLNQQNVLLDIVPLGIFTIDTNCILTSWNRKAEDITGLKSDVVKGVQCYSIKEDKDCAPDPCLYTEDKGKPIICRKITFTLNSRKIVIKSKSIDFIRDHNNQIIGAIGCFDKIES